MPQPRKLPDNEVLVRLRREGWTYEDIAQQYGVSKGAVYLRLRDANATEHRPTYSQMLPWKVRKVHTHAFPAQMLRVVGRMESEPEKVPAVKQRMMRKWLSEIKDADVVVAYHPEAPPNPASPNNGGFYYSRRRPSDGDALVRPTSTDEPPPAAA